MGCSVSMKSVLDPGKAEKGSEVEPMVGAAEKQERGIKQVHWEGWKQEKKLGTESVRGEGFMACGEDERVDSGLMGKWLQEKRE